MKFTLFKPNSKNTGSLCSFNISQKAGGSPELYASLVQQASWNDQSKRGSFSENAKNPEKSVNVKINAIEAGEFLSSFRHNLPFSAFHQSGNGDKTSISLSPSPRIRKVKTQLGDEEFSSPSFVFSLFRSGKSFRVGLEAGEVEVLSELLKMFIQLSLEAESSQQQSDGDNGRSQRQTNQRQTNQRQAQPQEQADDDDIPF